MNDEHIRKTACQVCFHHCLLSEGQTGLCRARSGIRENGGPSGSVCVNYGKFTSLAMDPIEKKPLARFYPGSMILSAGSFGCNLACPFCQNYTISQRSEKQCRYYEISPEELTDLAVSQPGNLGVAFTYNEPLISWEYLYDAGRLLHEAGLKVVLVTNGTAETWVLDKILPYVDAMNIDLKGDETFYKELGGSYRQTMQTIRHVSGKCHLEVTTLIIPGKNDNAAFIRRTAQDLAALDKDIVLHLSRYFPRYHMTIPETPRETVLTLRKEAQHYLSYVYTGNM